MDRIKVDRETLRERLLANRQAHQEQVLQANAAYRAAVIDRLESTLEQVRAGGVIDLAFNLPEPTDYTREYDRALLMLEWELEPEVELTEADFIRYVQDRWNWQGIFNSTTGSYIVR